MIARGLSYTLLQPTPHRQAAPSLWLRLRLWQSRRRERLLLAAMDDRGLADLGLSRIDAMQETRKPFWRA